MRQRGAKSVPSSNCYTRAASKSTCPNTGILTAVCCCWNSKTACVSVWMRVDVGPGSSDWGLEWKNAGAATHSETRQQGKIQSRPDVGAMSRTLDSLRFSLTCCSLEVNKNRRPNCPYMRDACFLLGKTRDPHKYPQQLQNPNTLLTAV